MKIGRNEPCFCGSGKKYKKCHLNKPADEQRRSLEKSFGEFGARSMMQTLKNVYGEKRGITSLKKNIDEILKKITQEKGSGNRSKPSEKLVSGKSKLSDKLRRELLDIIAEIVDQNPFGRSDMCVYFAILLRDALIKWGLSAKAILGKATYFSSDQKFTWDHGWVIFDNELIDGNVDSMIENPMIPDNIHPSNYWGLIDELPKDRKFDIDKEIDEQWEKVNTEYKVLVVWRKQLFSKIKNIETNLILGNKS